MACQGGRCSLLHDCSLLQRKKYGTREQPVDLYRTVQQYLTNVLDDHVAKRSTGSCALPARSP